MYYWDSVKKKEILSNWDSVEKERNDIWDSVEKERNVVLLGQCRKRRRKKFVCTIGTVQKKKEILYNWDSVVKRNVGHLGHFRKKEMLYIWDSLEKESNVVLLGQCRKRKKCCTFGTV